MPTTAGNKPFVLLVCNHIEMHAVVAHAGAVLFLIIRSSELSYIKDASIYRKVIGIKNEYSLQEWIDAAHEISRSAQIDHVFSFNELYLKSAYEVARCLGKEFYASPALIELFNNKVKMRKRLAAHQLDELPYAEVESVEQLTGFVRRHKKVILKPVNGLGSVGISVISSLRDIPAAWEWMMVRNKLAINWDEEKPAIMAEKFVKGQEYSIESFSENGEHFINCIVHKFKEKKHFIGQGHLIPAPLSDHQRSTIEEYVTRVLTCMGVVNGPCHTEVILAGDQPVILESHLRPGGARITDLIGYSFGIDVPELWIRQLMGESVKAELLRRSFTGYSCIRFYTPQEKGVLKAVTGKEMAMEDPRILRLEVQKSPGDHINGVARDSFSRVSYAIAKSGSPKTAVNAANKALRQLKFVIE